MAASQMAADGDVEFGCRRPDRVILRVAPGRPRLGVDEDLGHVGVPGPPFDLANAFFGFLDRETDRSPPPLMPIVVAVEPVVDLPDVAGVADSRGCLG